MESRYLLIVVLLDATIILHKSMPCTSSSVPTFDTFLDWGDMDDFIKFISKYQTSSQIIYPSVNKENKDPDQMGPNILLLVSKSNFYTYA